MNKEQLDFSIQGMTSVELKDKMSAWKNDKSNMIYWEFANKNHISYITNFFSEPLQEDGKYIDGTMLSDLLVLYYLDYRLKIILSKFVLDTERHFDIAMNNCGVKCGDGANTFSAKWRVFEKSTDVQKLKIVTLFDAANKTSNKTIKIFSNNIYAAMKLRNFCLHHYPVLSYKYANIIDNGNKHINKDGEERNLAADINSLNQLMESKYVESEKNRVKKHLVEKYDFSNDKIKENIYAFYNKVFGFNIVDHSVTKPKRNGLVSCMLSLKKKI